MAGNIYFSNNLFHKLLVELNINNTHLKTESKISTTSVDFCVERINCEDTSFRYPQDPPDPTPPPKHIRGGWVAPEKPKLTYVMFRNDLLQEVACKPKISSSVYAVTIVHEDLHLLLPDVNKAYIDQSDEAV